MDYADSPGLFFFFSFSVLIYFMFFFPACGFHVFSFALPQPPSLFHTPYNNKQILSQSTDYDALDKLLEAVGSCKDSPTKASGSRPAKSSTSPGRAAKKPTKGKSPVLEESNLVKDSKEKTPSVKKSAPKSKNAILDVEEESKLKPLPIKATAAKKGKKNAAAAEEVDLTHDDDDDDVVVSSSSKKLKADLKLDQESPAKEVSATASASATVTYTYTAPKKRGVVPTGDDDDAEPATYTATVTVTATASASHPLPTRASRSKSKK
jgi:hypothetical protein